MNRALDVVSGRLENFATTVEKCTSGRTAVTSEIVLTAGRRGRRDVRRELRAEYKLRAGDSMMVSNAV